MEYPEQWGAARRPTGPETLYSPFMEFDPGQLSWRNQPAPAAERMGRSYNGLRVLVVLILLWSCFGLVLGIVGTMPLAVAGNAPPQLPVAVVLAAACFLGLSAIGRHWGVAASKRVARQLVFGAGGAALSGGWSRFRREDIAKGAEGERWTAQALETLLDIPGTRIFHGLRFPGSHVADIDHAVINGDRVVYIDSKFWKPGQYQWIDRETLASVHARGFRRRTIHMDVVQTHPRTAKVAAEVACHVIAHANAPGPITFTPGHQISPTGIPITGVQAGVDGVGHWLLQGKKAGTVNRYAVARLLAMQKKASAGAGTRRTDRGHRR
jgi:hypothetical protein